MGRVHGLKMIDVECMVKHLLLAWMKGMFGTTVMELEKIIKYYIVLEGYFSQL